MSVGIIGGADGPTSIFLTSSVTPIAIVAAIIVIVLLVKLLKKKK